MSHIVQTNTKTSQECETALISQLWSVMVLIIGSVMVSVMRSVMESVMGSRLNKKSLLVFPKYHMECNMIWKILQNIHRDHYICDVKWLDTGSLAVLWMNRFLGVDQPCDHVCKNNDCNDDTDDGCNAMMIMMMTAMMILMKAIIWNVFIGCKTPPSIPFAPLQTTSATRF